MRVIDSHTEGEPTRVIVAGGPDLGSGTLAERRSRFEREFDHVRRGTILEPRGSDALVGALLCPPTDDRCSTGAIFFNNEGYLGMCGHAAMGVAVTLAHLHRVELGRVAIETPVGAISVELTDPNQATVENVPSFCYLRECRPQRRRTRQGQRLRSRGVGTGSSWSTAPLARSFPATKHSSGAPRSRSGPGSMPEPSSGRTASRSTTSSSSSHSHSADADSRNFVLMPRQCLRPVALWNRHQRQARLPRGLAASSPRAKPGYKSR